MVVIYCHLVDRPEAYYVHSYNKTKMATYGTVEHGTGNNVIINTYILCHSIFKQAPKCTKVPVHVPITRHKEQQSSTTV